MDLIYRVKETLLQGKSVVIVSSSDSGKTYWVKNNLIPFLGPLEVAYFQDGNSINDVIADVYIFDEAETLCDRKYLEACNSDEVFYYSESYLQQVKHWHDFYKKFTKPSLYIITRNNDNEIDNLVSNFKKSDWDGRTIEALRFIK